MKRLAAVLLLFVLVAGCARFKIQELKPVVLFSVPVTLSGGEQEGAESASIPAERNGRVVFNFPLRPYFNSSYVYIPDPPRKLIRVFDTTAGTLDKMILPQGSPIPVPDGVERLTVELNLPGWIAGDATENLYIQNFLPDPGSAEDENVPAPENREPGALMTLRRPPTPSVILQLDDDGQPLYTLYEDPPSRKPFEEILRMNGGEEGRLFVLHTIRDKKERRRKFLSEYRGGLLVARYGRNEWGSKKERDDYWVDLEDMVSEDGGKYVLACVAFRERDSHRAAYRKIYRIEGRVQVNPNRDDDETPPPPAEEILVTQNQSDFFAWVRPDGGFFLMNPEADGSSVLYKIYDRTGEYINNQKIAFRGPYASWRDSFVTGAGRIYTPRLYRGKFEIYEWQ